MERFIGFIDELEANKVKFKTDSNAKCYNAKARDATLVQALVSAVGLETSSLRLSDLLRVCKYRTDECLGMHRDAPFEDGMTHVIVVYLNDDFDGGKLDMYTADMQWVEQITPKAGMAVVFPIDRFHATTPITRGIKYCISLQATLTQPTQA